METRKFFIYGIYDLSGLCHYVGQTTDIQQRKYNHLEWSSGHFYNTGFLFRVLRVTNMANVNRLELQIGTAYKRKNQATKSKVFGSSKVRKLPELTPLMRSRLEWNWSLDNTGSLRRFMDCQG